MLRKTLPGLFASLRGDSALGGIVDAALAGLTFSGRAFPFVPIRETITVTLNRRHLNQKLPDRSVIYHMDIEDILPRPEKIMDLYPEDAIINVRLGESVPISINWLEWMEHPSSFITEVSYDYDAFMLEVDEMPLGLTTSKAMVTPLEEGDMNLLAIARTSNGSVFVSTIRLNVT